MVRGRINERDQAKLANPRQPAKCRRVDQRSHARRERHIDLVRNADQVPPRRQAF